MITSSASPDGSSAPSVAITMIGYPNTTGLEEIDSRLTDEWADPPGATEQWHTEKLVRLGRGFIAYQPDASAPEVAELPARGNGFVTFGSFNHPVQLSSATLRVWGRILKEVERSRLVLKFRSLWTVRTPPGYSCLFTAPFNRFEIPFTPLSGIVETDTYYNEVNIPTLCHLTPNSSITLAAGTPIFAATSF